MYAYGLIIILPLNLLPNVGKMGFTSIFGVFSIFLLIVIIVVQMPRYIVDYYDNIYRPEDKSTHMNLWDLTTGFSVRLYFFKSFATFLYSFGCHYAAIPIYSVLSTPTYRRMDKVITRSISLDAVIYLVVGVSGFLTQPIGTPDLIIERRQLGDSDYVISIGKVLFLLSITLKLPACYNSLRISFNTMAFGNSEMTLLRNVLITGISLGLSIIVGVYFQGVSDYISFLGGFCGVFIGYIFPGLVYIKAFSKEISSVRVITIAVFIIIVSLIGLTGAGVTLYYIINPYDAHKL